MTIIRSVEKSDIDDVVALSEIKRTNYATYQPLFWRKSADSAERQTAYFQHLIEKLNTIMLVHITDVVIDGFIIASVLPAPPVYDIGGLNCMIDDFCIRDETQWMSVGQSLLNEAIRLAQEQGAVQVVVVTGHHHTTKREFLQSCGLTLASEWYTTAISKTNKDD